MEPASSSAVFDPVAAPSTYEETIARLGVAIRIGVLGPGVRLPPERELALQLGISRSTLRQALAVLTGTGHLTAFRGRTGGTFVSEQPPVVSVDPFPQERSRALLDRRMALELGTAGLAADRATDLACERLSEAAQALDDDAVLDDWAAFRRADAAFHLRLADAAGSPGLVLAMTRVHGELSDLFYSLQPSLGLRAACREEHGEIAEAVAHADAGAAREAMARHLIATERAIDGAGVGAYASTSVP